MNIYVEKDLHNSFKSAVTLEDKTITEVLLASIRDYVAKHPAKPPRTKRRR